MSLAAAAVLVTGCSADVLNVPNPNSPTVAGASGDPGALQLQATGVLRQLRGGLGGYITTVARFGREGYIYTPNEGRNTSHYLIGLAGQNRLDPAGFAVGVWAGPYGNLRDIFNLKNVLTNNTTLTAAQRSAGLGFAKTIEGLELLYVISTRDSLGAVTQINQNATDIAPFVSRDSVYRFILGRLDEGAADLAAGGAAFPFTLHAGFAGFNTPTTFRLFNRAIAARAAAYWATSGGGATAWTRAQTAIAASFLNRTPANAAAMNTGVFHVYSTATGDATNGVGQNADFLAHPSFGADVSPGDLRASKWSTLAVARNAPQGLGIATNLTIVRYATNTTPVPVIRNEELVLLDAEIRLATADKAGAIANINAVRSVSGGLAATTLTPASADAAVLDEILRQKRFSLFAEGHRWVDMRRYGRLNTLPLDLTTGVNAHFIARVMPIPQGECLVRARADVSLAGPGC
ncbi:MAG: RagB/SusD family nutrient uptake outer membrane protein [Gemmatimonadaceae bacterium]